MNIPLDKLNYTFHTKPLLVGGKAMEYYGLRKAGTDIDFIAEEKDVIALIKLYPDRVKDLWGDLGVCPFEFEIWRSIEQFKYKDLIEGATEEKEYFVISLEKLLLMKALATNDEKYIKDTKLIVEKISEDQYKHYDKERSKIKILLEGIHNITYIEKTGPESENV